MSDILIASVSRKGQVTLPKTVRSILKLGFASCVVGFRIGPKGKVEIVPVEVIERKATPYTEEEWARIEKLSGKRGRIFKSGEAAKRHLKRL